jgi:hypothetical protein
MIGATTRPAQIAVRQDMTHLGIGFSLVQADVGIPIARIFGRNARLPHFDGIR